MKNVYQTYWPQRKLLQTEEATISYLDIANSTRYLKQFQKNKITTEEIAHKNHDNGVFYVVTIFEEEKPICFLEINSENSFIGVNFLDETGGNYLTFHFDEIESKKKLFLEELWYYHSPAENSEGQSYRMLFRFDEKGNLSFRKYEGVQNKTTDYKVAERIDITGLYEVYPEFGKYEGLLRLQRIGLEIVHEIITAKDPSQWEV